MGLRHDALLRTDSALASLLADEIARVESDNPEVVLGNLHFGLREVFDNEEARADWLTSLDEVIMKWAEKYGAGVVERTASAMVHRLKTVEEERSDE